MSLNLHLPSKAESLRPKITVVGVGGAGGNAVNNMITSNLEGVNFVVANTDAQALENSLCERRIQLGSHITQGLGAGARPEVGRAAAEEAAEEISEYIGDSNMLFITGGMGGGTGTGAGPVIASIARERGILTVGVVTKPFQFEGAHRMRTAETGIEELQHYVDTLIVIPNQNLFRLANERTTFADAFKMADDVLHSGVRGVTDLMVMPGLINLDFADIRTVMSEMGKAMMGTGEATGDRRAIDAAEAAISNPLLDDVSMKGARGVLINITGGLDMTLFEVDEAANRIREEVDTDANIIFGSTFNDQLEGTIRVSVVATGIEAAVNAQQPPVQQFKQRTVVSVKKPTSAPSLPARPIATGPARPVEQPKPAQEPVAETETEETKISAREEVRTEATINAAPARTVEEPQLRGPAAGGPSIMPQPQRPVHTTQSAPAQQPPLPEKRDERGFSFFQKVAGVGKAFSAARAEAQEQIARESTQQPARAEAVEKSAKARQEEDLFDIPAFLRRQAN